MARPVKRRRICCLPEVTEFIPGDGKAEGTVTMTMDEFEAVRLIDRLGLSQEDCAAQMNVARTTVQNIYDSARKKLADCLVNGKRLEIRGGNYQLCPDGGNCCGKNCGKLGCRRRRCNNKPGGDCNEDCCNI